MIKVTVERGSHDWGVGDLVQYPDDTIVLVTGHSNCLVEGVRFYKNAAISYIHFWHSIDELSTNAIAGITNKNVPRRISFYTRRGENCSAFPWKFKGELVLEQHPEDADEPIEAGELVEYPDGEIAFVVSWDDDDAFFQRVTLKRSDHANDDIDHVYAKVGRYCQDSSKKGAGHSDDYNGRVKKFNGKLIFKQS